MKQLLGKHLLIATHNRGKFEEIERLLTTFKITALFAGDMGLPIPEETEDSFLGNARIKAHAAARAAQCPALADDSGLEIAALGGAPGVYSADWAETPSGTRDFTQAMQRVWERLETQKAPFPRLARFCCTLVLAWPDGKECVFPGAVDGQIVWPMRGNNGHGYDPIFMPKGYETTFGEMDRWEKNTISHRADAFKKLAAHLSELGKAQ